MSNNVVEEAMANLSREEVMSALFANLIVQQTNMAFMFLGRVPHPETGERMYNLENAKYFIDQVEMLEVKTRGNLDRQEESLLKESLTSLRLAFVEAVEHPEAIKAKQGQEKPAAPAEPHVQTANEIPDEDSKKKFSKKY